MRKIGDGRAQIAVDVLVMGGCVNVKGNSVLIFFKSLLRINVQTKTAVRQEEFE